MVKNLPVMQETWVDPCVGKIPWRRTWLPTPVFWPEKSCGWRLVGYLEPTFCGLHGVTKGWT